MRSLLRPVLPLLAAAAAAACTGTPSPAGPSPVTLTMPGDTRVAIADFDADAGAESVDATAERVWAVLPGVYQELGIPVALRDSAGWQFGNPRVQPSTRVAGELTSRWVRCANEGAGPSAVTPYRVQLTVVTRLRPGANGRTGVATQVIGTGLASDGTGRFTSHCVSTGRLEQIVLAAIARRL